jgi:hypothetical protein
MSIFSPQSSKTQSRSRISILTSLSISRFFSGPQSSSSESSSDKELFNKKSLKERDRFRHIYNKIAYERDVVIILLIKIRTKLDISLFDRISFKNVAVTKILYVCLSNTKKTQYKTQAKQIIRSFLDIKISFNR